jgi:hypothetical protein
MTPFVSFKVKMTKYEAIEYCRLKSYSSTYVHYRKPKNARRMHARRKHSMNINCFSLSACMRGAPRISSTRIFGLPMINFISAE